jgi:hypothetical protein
MFTEKSQASIELQGGDECEELKVEEEKNEYFEYHFHPVPSDPGEGTMIGDSNNDKNRVEVDSIELQKPLNLPRKNLNS